MIDRIIQLALNNRLLMLVLGAVVVVSGYYSYRQLPVDAFPDVSPNLVQVFTVTEGLAPEEIETYVTYPIETVMNGLPSIENIRSVSNFGLSVVNIYFADGIDIYFARQLVNERLQEAREQIPEGFGEPALGPISTGMGLVLFYYLEDTTGEHSLEELRTIQDWLVKFHLQTVPGVTEILGIGGYEKQFHVVVDPHALLRYGVTLHNVIEQIEANNLNVGAQFIEKDAEEYVVRSVGLASTVEDIENIVIKAGGGTPIFLNQVAEVGIGGAIRRGVQTRNGVEEVVAGMVIKLFGTNSSTVIERVEAKMEELNRILPAGVRLVPYYEQKTLVAACVATVTNALIQGIVLVTLVLVLFMGSVRPSLVVALSIPFSVLFATLGMHYFGLSANLMSLGGLAIAIGMMVDGTIVVVENVDRTLRQAAPDEGRIQVVARACVEVGRPIVFAIVIIILVFLPLFTLQGSRGQNLPPPRLHGGHGHVGLADFCPVPGPGVVEPAAAGTQIHERRHPSQRRLDDASLGGRVSTHCHSLRRPPLLGTRLSGRPPAHRTGNLSAPRIGVYPGPAGRYPSPAADHGPLHIAQGKHPPHHAGRAPSIADPRSYRRGFAHRSRRSRRSYRPHQQRRDVFAAQAHRDQWRDGP